MTLVERLAGGPWGQSAYLVMNGSDAIVIDPGGSADGILAALERRKVALRAIVNTHGHFDHIGGVQALIETTGAPFYISGLEVPIMKSSNMLRFIFKIKEKVVVPTSFTDLDALPLDLHFGPIDVRRVPTPGHTPGGQCLVIDGHLFSGDTLLNTFPATADLPGGDPTALLESFDVLRRLPPDLIIHPGHGRETSLGEALAAVSLSGTHDRGAKQ